MLQSNTLTMVSSTFENNNLQVSDLVRVGLYEINRLHNSYFGSMSES